MPWIPFVVGMFLGVVVGVLGMGLLWAREREELEAELNRMASGMRRMAGDAAVESELGKGYWKLARACQPKDKSKW